MRQSIRFLTICIALVMLASYTGPAPGHSVAYAQAPAAEPMLRLDAGMHTASIRRLATDAEGRYLVSGSYDKTVRVWDLATGSHLKTLRPPIGDGNEGMIFGVAVSPDGSTIAAAGRTGRQWDESCSIYLFERESGNLIGRIAGLPSVVLHLAYSGNGELLLATLAEGKGVRLYNGRDYSSIGRDEDYAGSVYDGDFDDEGRLVTVSDKGQVRLYDQYLGLIAKQKTRAGKAPSSVSFSPDGSRVAVGFFDSKKVEILSGQDLSPLHSPNTKGVNNGNLSSVAWSRDGSMLYAGGRWSNAKGINLIRRWGKQGSGRYRDLEASSDTVLHLLTLPGGGVAYSAGDPAIGVFDGEYHKIVDLGRPIIDFRDTEKDLLVSSEGAVIQFSHYEETNTLSTRFSIPDRLLELGRFKEGQLSAPVTSVKGLRIDKWKNSRTPTVNGRKLPLDQHEHSWCVAVAPDRETFVLGSDWSLRRFDRLGSELWKVPVSGVVRAVNVTGNGEMAVAALSDGTIHWYRMSDGQEILAFFTDADRRKWVLWTPSGYYDASVGADNIIGWHKNNGADAAADFFPIAQFRSVYYRPDVTQSVLEKLGENEALQFAQESWGRSEQKVEVEEMLPPVVTITYPPDEQQVEAEAIPVRFKIRSPSNEPITGIKVLVDGRPVVSNRGMKGVDDNLSDEIEIAIPNKDCAISVIAENRYSVSEPATVKVRWQARGVEQPQQTDQPAPGPDEFVIKPKLYVLAVGVSQYELQELILKLSAKDAQDFADAMQKQKGGLYDDVVVRTLIDDHATKDDILDGLDWLRKETTQKDVAMIFISGHGLNDNRSGNYYYLPVNADPERLMRTGLPYNAIKTTVESIPGKILLFMDTCHSGNVMGRRGRGLAVGDPDIMGVVNELTSAETGAVVFASSSGNQQSFETDEWGNGAFTKALLEGLGGQADVFGKGKITINMLELYISERVKELTDGQQTPTTSKPQTIRDFPVAMAQL